MGVTARPSPLLAGADGSAATRHAARAATDQAHRGRCRTAVALVA
jgi:hypothetical protein